MSDGLVVVGVLEVDGLVAPFEARVKRVHQIYSSIIIRRG